MPTLRIEHAVPDYETWKAAFDRDPIDRRGSGVRRYRIVRPVDDARYVRVDLEFDTLLEAEAVQRALRELWRRVDVARDPRSRIVETVATADC